MWRRACPVLLFVVAVGLVLTRRRVGQLEADELERARARAGAPGQGMAETVSAEASTNRRPLGALVGVEGAETAIGGQDLASEWEQAVPPMDS